MKAARFALSLVLAGLTGCHGGGPSTEVPARIVDPTPESHKELTAVVARALDVEDVALSSDALTGDSRLVIEQTSRQDLEHGRILGRDLRQPEQFRLVKRGHRCILIHVGSAERWELTQARCVAE